MRRILALILLLAGSLQAAFEFASRDLLGPRSAGMAGADVAAPESLEAMLGNPAALPEDAEIRLMLLDGMDPGRLANAAVLAAALKSDLRLGLLYQLNLESRLSPLNEETLALGASLELGADLIFGMRLKWQSLQAAGPGSAQGLGLDLGLLRDEISLPFLPGRFSLGLSADDVASSWPEGWAQTLPALARAGLGWKPWPSLTLGAEHSWSRAPQLVNPNLESWRFGLQWQALPALSFRGGWRSELGPQASLGLGARLPWLGAEADYAILLRSDSLQVSHRLALTLLLPRPRGLGLSVRPRQVLRDPEDLSIRQALFDVGIDPLLKPLSWKLEIMNEDGTLAQALTPTAGTAGATLGWNGRDAKGKRLRLDADLKTLLTVQTQDGKTLSLASDMSLEREVRKAEQGDALALVEDGGLDAPQLRPVFDEAGGSKLSHVVVAMPKAASRNVEAWELDFSDSDDHLLRRLEGEGNLPKEVVWDGKDAQGKTVENALGVQLKVELREKGGKKATRALPLFSQKAFEIAHAEAKARPPLQLASLGLPLLLDRPALGWEDGQAAALAEEARRHEAAERDAPLPAGDGSGGGAVFLDVFDEGENTLRPDQAYRLKPLVQAIKARKGLTLVITGTSRKGEKQHPGLAQRRAMALVKELQAYGSQGLQIVLKVPQEYENAKGVRVEIR